MTLLTLERAATVETAAISGVASSPAVDSYGHSVRAGAFDASIRKRGLTGPQGIKLLAGHAGFPIGRIIELRTVASDLRISAELNLELQSARDLHSIIKHSGGLNFSVGFRLEDFDVVENAKPPNEPWLIVKKGDLTEVSIVTFPALAEAQMDLKSRSTPAWLAKALAELQRTQALLDPRPDTRWTRFVAETSASQVALMRKVVETRRTLDKRDRDEETLRRWRHWSDARARSLRGRLNI